MDVGDAKVQETCGLCSSFLSSREAGRVLGRLRAKKLEKE